MIHGSTPAQVREVDGGAGRPKPLRKRDVQELCTSDLLGSTEYEPSLTKVGWGVGGSPRLVDADLEVSAPERPLRNAVPEEQLK
jgi:hypothetical protein